MKRLNLFRRLLPISLLSFCTLAFLVGVLAFLSDEVGAKPEAVTVSGSIITDTVWTAVASPYVLTDTVTITPGVTLTIEPGVMVMAQDDSFTALIVENGANLIAVGMPTDPITFTSVADSAPGQWSGVLLRGGAQFEYITFRYGTYNIDIESSTGDLVSIENSTIRDSSDYGLYVDSDALHRLQMANVTYANNTFNRVFIDGTDWLAGNATLSPQLGLEGYEIGNWLGAREGITFTIDPGVTVMAGDEYAAIGIWEGGHLQAVGTADMAITFTVSPDSNDNMWSGIYLRGGSAQLIHTIVRYSNPTILIDEAAGDAVLIENSTIQDGGGYGLQIDAIALHRLHMTNVSFLDNAINRVLIDTNNGDNLLFGNAILSSQPGLEGYEVSPSYLEVPDGITLTLEPGVALYSASTLIVRGYLDAVGTTSSPITLTSVEDNAPGQWHNIFLDNTGAHLENTVIRYARFNFSIGGISNKPVILRDSLLSEAEEFPLEIGSNALHRLQMENVTFRDNLKNRVSVRGCEGYDDVLMNNAILSAQPGLEGYELECWWRDTKLSIPAGLTLTMEPGVTLFVDPDAVVDVEGHLQAVGTAVSPITFTTINTGSERWAGLVVTGSAELVHANVIESGNSGVDVRGGQVSVACSTFAENGGDGVVVADGGSPLVTLFDSNIFNNDGAGVLNDSGNEIDGRYNWWGDASGPGGQGPGNGDEISGTIRYQPWLTTPSTCTAGEIADLTLTVDLLADNPVLPGQPVSYAFTFSNNGPGQATAVTLTHPLLITLIGVSISSSLPITPTGNVSYTWQLPDLDVGERGVITVNGRVSPTLITTTTIPIQATIDSQVIDLDPGNNSEVVSLTVDLPQVQFSQSVYTVTESMTAVPITLTLDIPNPYAPVTVELHVGGELTTVVTFTPGITSLAYHLPLPESGTTLTLANPVGALLGELDTAVVVLPDESNKVYLPLIVRP